MLKTDYFIFIYYKHRSEALTVIQTINTKPAGTAMHFFVALIKLCRCLFGSILLTPFNNVQNVSNCYCWNQVKSGQALKTNWKLVSPWKSLVCAPPLLSFPQLYMHQIAYLRLWFIAGYCSYLISATNISPPVLRHYLYHHSPDNTSIFFHTLSAKMFALFFLWLSGI